MYRKDADHAAQVLDSLRQLVRSLRVTAHSVERKHGISGAQLFVLRELQAEPGSSIRRLAQRTLTDPSSVSVVVGRLVDEKLVARSSDPADARRSVLSLTAAGRRLLRSSAEPFQTRLARAVRSLPAARLERLSADLGLLVQKSGAARGRPPMFFDDSRRGGTDGR